MQLDRLIFSMTNLLNFESSSISLFYLSVSLTSISIFEPASCVLPSDLSTMIYILQPKSSYFCSHVIKKQATDCLQVPVYV